MYLENAVINFTITMYLKKLSINFTIAMCLKRMSLNLIRTILKYQIPPSTPNNKGHCLTYKGMTKDKCEMQSILAAFVDFNSTIHTYILN